MFVWTSCSVVSSSTTSLNFNTPPLTVIAPCDARLVSYTRKKLQKSKKARLPTDSCLNKPLCQGLYNHSLVLNNLKHLLSLSSRVHGLSKKFSPRLAVSQCSQNFALHLAIALLLFFSLISRHDPFIVRSAKLVHRSMVSLSFAHPCRCSRPSLTIVCFCAAAPSPAPSPARRHLVVECGIQ